VGEGGGEGGPGWVISFWGGEGGGEEGEDKDGEEGKGEKEEVASLGGEEGWLGMRVLVGRGGGGWSACGVVVEWFVSRVN
jgi:hypothetical protein